MKKFSIFSFGLVPFARMTLALAAGTLATGPLRADEPGSVITLTENNRTQTLHANGGVVTVAGNGNKLTILGECRELTVQGNKNEITVEAVAAVSVPGNKNRVTWSRALGGEKPQVSNLGSDNEIGTDTH